MEHKKSDSHSRELSDPDEESNPLPWYVIMAMGALFMWGLFYISQAYMGADSFEGDNRTVAVAAQAVGGMQAVAAIDGGEIYQGKCVACHQANGEGVPGVFPPLAGSEWVLGNPERLAHIPLHGIQGKLTVKGTAYNGQMPVFGALLTDGEIAAVLTYVRSQWGNKADAVTEAMVKKVREATKDKTTPYNGDEELSKL
ncbi:MAG: c-type cytochrome [Methylophilaceae bacterium]